MIDGKRTILRLQGMDDGPNPEPGWAERIDNLTCDATGAWRNCTDWKELYVESTSPTRPTGTVAYQSLYWWGQRGTARQWLVWERATSATACALEVFDGIAKTYKTLATGRLRVETPNPGTTYIPLNGWLYLINGHDQPVRWNGRWPDNGSALVQVGFNTTPPPPNVTLGTTDNALTTSGQAPSGLSVADATFRYGYAITYVNDVGAESPPSPTVYITGTNGAAALAVLCHGKLTISTPPSHVRMVRIYRTVDLGTTGAAAVVEGARFSLYHLLDLPSATSQVWDDGLSDGLLGHQLDESQTGLYPNGTTYAAVFKGTLFLAGSPTYPDRVFYSAPGLVEQFPAANTFDFSTGTGGEITGIKAMQNALVVFRRRGVYLIKGDPVNGFYAQTISEDVGCIAPGAIGDVPGSQAILFFAQDGPMLLTASANGSDGSVGLTPVVDKISRLWCTEIDKGAMMGARCVRYTRDQEILFVLPGHTGTFGQQGLAYHYVHGYWSLRDYADTTKGYAVGALCQIDDHRGMVAMASRNGVYVSAGRRVNSSGIPVWRYRLGWIGDRWERSTLARIEVVGSLAAARTADPPGIGLRYAADRKPLTLTSLAATWSGVTFDETVPAAGDSQAIETEYVTDTWDLGAWDTGYWQRPTTRVYPVSLGGAGYEHQIELMGGGVDAEPIELVGIALWVVGGPKQAHLGQGLGGARP